MNVERLHAIALALQDDYETTKIVERLKALVTSLHNQINNPSDPSFQQVVATNLESLRDALSSSAVSAFPPTWKQVLKEIGAEDLSGEALEIQIEEIFSRNQITLAVAHRELNELLTNLKSIATSIDEIVSAFHELGIGAEDLNTGECELGVLVPRNFVENRLDNFSKELRELNQIFGVFSELAIGNRPGFQIRTIASTDLSIFLDTAPAVGACVAIAMERIIAIYQKLLEIKKLQGELAKQGLEKKNMQGIEDHANKAIEKEIESVVKDLVKEYRPGSQKERTEELSIELKFALKKIANRIDRGFNIEIRMGEPAKDDDDNEIEEESAENKRYRDRIESATSRMQFIRVDGEPILSLPEQKRDSEQPVALAKNPKKRAAAKTIPPAS